MPQVNRFLVVDVDMDYDCINDIRYDKSFCDREEAEKYIELCAETWRNFYNERNAYIYKWIENLEDDYKHLSREEWEQYLQKYFPFILKLGQPGNNPSYFKTMLTTMLHSGHIPQNIEYIPRDLPEDANTDLMIIDLEKEE